MTLAPQPPPRSAALPRPAQRAPIGQGAILPARRAVFPYRNASSFAQTAKLDALCFVIHTSSFCRNPFVLTFIQIARGCTPSCCTALCFDNDTKPRVYPRGPWERQSLIGALRFSAIESGVHAGKKPSFGRDLHGPNSLCCRRDGRTMHKMRVRRAVLAARAKEVRSGDPGSEQAVRPQLPGRPRWFDRPSGLTGRQP
jgi:hypothetical protein